MGDVRGHLARAGADLTPPTAAARGLCAQFPQGIFLVAAVAAVALHLAWQMPWPSSQWVSTAGILFALAGVGLMAGSAVTLWRRGTSPLPWIPSTALVTTGPYRFTRNPIYLGDVMLVAGLGAWLGIGWLVVAAIIAIPACTRNVIEHEEAYLAERFPEAWPQYRHRVRRWL